jgi:hypothetical protein
MRWLSRLSLFLGVLSLLFSGFMILVDDRVRADAFAGRFPLTSLREGVVAMTIPLALSTAALLLSLVCLNYPGGRWGAVTGVFGLLAASIILGREGFEVLF